MANFDALLACSSWQTREVICPAGTLIGGACEGMVPPTVSALLCSEERQFAETLSGDSRRQWIAGRYCLAMALRANGLTCPVLQGPNGRPLLPIGVAASISHKRSISVAIATTMFEGIGIDIEHVDEDDCALAEKVLTNTERDGIERFAKLSPTVVTIHFALKEAVYKAAPDNEQDDLEFENIVLTPSTALIAEGAWVNISTTVLGSTSEYRAHAFRLGDWILAVSTRS